jgi:hypothetical protein
MAALCLLAVAPIVQAQAVPPQTERVETGNVPCPATQPPQNPVQGELKHGPPMCHYNIRLLPLSSFPQLPSVVVQQLEERGCMIPQTYEAHSPENVIHGSFQKPGSSDWAALCSVRGVTTLYVFFQSDFANPVPLRHQSDSTWLGVEWSLDYGSAWGIATQPARLMRPTDNADHDGIQDAFVEQSSVVHYFNNDRWTMIDSNQ